MNVQGVTPLAVHAFTSMQAFVPTGPFALENPFRHPASHRWQPGSSLAAAWPEPGTVGRLHQPLCSSWVPSALLCFQVLYHISNTLSTAKLQSICKPETNDPRRHLMQPGAWLGHWKCQQVFALLAAQGVWSNPSINACPCSSVSPVCARQSMLNILHMPSNNSAFSVPPCCIKGSVLYKGEPGRDLRTVAAGSRRFKPTNILHGKFARHWLLERQTVVKTAKRQWSRRH
jgi:hypothetical protein